MNLELKLLLPSYCRLFRADLIIIEKVVDASFTYSTVISDEARTEGKAVEKYLENINTDILRSLGFICYAYTF